MNIYDVAIIGYGPTGMTLAALLGQLGHRIVVLERHAGLYNLPRAACFDDEIMRIFQKLGIVDDIMHGAVVQRDYEWLNAAGETLHKIEYADSAPAGWAALYMMFQPEIEAVLDRLDKKLPTVEVRQGLTISEIAQDDESVTLRGIDNSGSAVSVRARYAVGADGGSSFVRRQLFQKVDDYGFQENWLVCDFHLRRTVKDLPMFRQICDPAQPTSIVRIGPQNHRFSFMLDPGVTADQATDENGVWTRVSKYLSREDAELIRVANYVFRSRIVSEWRHGRVFLAGDAAHEMPPFLGQGMCSGIRDGHNLAWKLDLVLNNRAEESLLDTYQVEREPHVRFITEKAIELGRVQTLRDPVAARARDETLLAARRAQQQPDKIKLPNLTGGLIADSGEFFPQAVVRRDDTKARFDDIVGPGWCVVASDPEIVDALSAGQLAAWKMFGGNLAVFGRSQEPNCLDDADGAYSEWFNARGCSAAVVRPDWHVYGTAQDSHKLSALLDGLAVSLRAGTETNAASQVAGPPLVNAATGFQQP